MGGAGQGKPTGHDPRGLTPADAPTTRGTTEKVHKAGPRRHIGHTHKRGPGRVVLCARGPFVSPSTGPAPRATRTLSALTIALW